MTKRWNNDEKDEKDRKEKWWREKHSRSPHTNQDILKRYDKAKIWQKMKKRTKEDKKLKSWQKDHEMMTHDLL
jgi:hypothetical protein